MHFSLSAQSAIVAHDAVVVIVKVVISVVVSIDDKSVGKVVADSPLLAVNISSVGMLS